MKHLIIYWKNRNYKGIDFIDYSLIEKYWSDNLVIKWMDIMYMWETKKHTKEIFNDRLETQKNKLEKVWYNYWDIIYELRYWKKDQ